MKKLQFLFLAYLFLVGTVLGQNKNEFYDTQHAFTQNFPVSPDQRKLIAIELPEGTTSIVYRITVGKKNQEIGKSLVDAVNSIPNPATATIGAFTKLVVSLSSYEAKYFIFSSEENALNYKNGRQYSYCKTTGELTSATVKMLSSNCFGDTRYLYFGFHTNELLIDYYVTLEVVPWVEKEDLTVWTAEYRDELFETYKSNLISNGVQEKTAIDLSNCIINKLVEQKTPEDLNNLSESEYSEIITKISEECVQILQGGAKTEEQQKGATYGSLAWKAYKNGELDKAIDYSKKALEKDNTLGWVQANLGLFFLIKNDELTATDYYIDAISNIKKDKLNAKNTFQEVIDDINNAIKKYPDLKGYKEILSQLQQEHDKL